MEKIEKKIPVKLNFTIIIFITLMISINYLSFQNELFFHFLAEVITIVISACLFAVSWIIRRKIDNGFFTVLGIGLLYIAYFDAMHILTFSGMNVFPEFDINHSLYFWISARFLQSLTFLIAPICTGRKTKYSLAGFLGFLFSAGLTYLIVNNLLPALINSDGSNSSYRIFMESIIVILFLASLIFLCAKRTNFDRNTYLFIVFSILLAMASEIIITINTNQYHLVSVLGLDTKILSYFLIFQTILITGIEKPQEIFYRGLQTSLEQLDNLFNNLNEGICIIDQNDEFVFSNPAASQIFGLKKNSLASHHLTEFISAEQKKIYLHHKDLQEQNKISFYELEITRPNNEKRLLKVTASPQFLNKVFSGLFVIFHDFTEQKVSESKLDEARQLYQTLFMDAPIRIWELDCSKVKIEIDQLKKDGVQDFKDFFDQHPEYLQKLASLVKVNTYNKLVEKLYTSNKNTNIKKLTEIFWNNSYPNFINEILAIVNNQTKINFELTTKTADGKIHYSIINWAVLPGYEQDYSRVIASAEDVTDRTNTQMELQASEEKFRSLAENAGVSISYYDLSGNIVFINAKALLDVNGRPENYIGKNIDQVFDREWSNKTKSRIFEAESSKNATFYEDVIDTPSGRKWYSLNFNRILDNQGKCVGVQSIATNITERKLLENELQSLARFPQENPNPVMRVSRKGQVLYSNQGSQKILAQWDYINQGIIPVDLLETVHDCLENNKAEVIEVEVEDNVLSLYLAPISEMDYVNIYGMNITQQKNAEAQLRKHSSELEEIVKEKTKELIEAQESLVRQEKLAVMGQLASGVGHELRNPLAVINNSTYMLKIKADKENNISTEYLDIIDQEVAGANKIITDLLTFARIKPAILNSIPPYSLLEKVLKKFAPPENVKLENKLAHNLPLINVDDKQIEQIITNVITNAYQAMPAGGKLIIIGKEIRGKIQIDFIDNGVGIPEENLEKIFEPLFTTKSRGIGLGLTISKMLAEINQGKLTVQSNVGEGSTFSLYLPVIK